MSRSKLAQLGIGTSGSAASQKLLFTQFNPGNRRDPIDIGSNLGGYGNLGHPVQITRHNVVVVQPTGQFKPSLEEWAVLLPWILNTTGVTTGADTAFNPGTAALLRGLDYYDTAVFHRLSGVAVNRATISAQARQEVVLDLECLGQSYTNAGSMPSLNLPLGTRFLFSDLGLTIDGVGAIPCRSFRLTIDHQLAPDRYFYGSTIAAPLNLDRLVTLRLEIPHALASTIWSLMAVDGGIAVSLELTAVAGATPVTSKLVFEFPAVRAPDAPPPAVVPQEQFVTIEANCYTVADVDTPSQTLQEVLATLTPVVA